MSFNLGNLADGLTRVGNGIMQNMTFYARSKMALHNSGGGCCGGGSVWTQGCCGGGGYYGGSCFGGNLYAGNAMNINFAYQRGVMMMREALANMPAATGGSVTDTDTPAATPVESSQDTTLGAMFENIVKSGGSLDFAKSELESETDASKKEEKYNQLAKNLGKSLLMNMDKNSGDGNGELSLDEFLNNEMKDLSAADKEKYKALYQQAFSQMDLNGDGKIDWKEMTAMITSYDSGSDGKYNGEITQDDLKTTNQNLFEGKLSSKLRSEYNRMFKSSES